MTLPRLDAIVAHWDEVPPLAVSVAAIAGVMGVGRADKSKRTGAPAKRRIEEQDPQALFDLLGGVGFGQGKPAWLMEAETT